MGHWRHGIEEEGVHHGLAVVVAPREAQVKGGANEREEKQREYGEGVAEPCVGVVGRAVREREGDVEPLVDTFFFNSPVPHSFGAAQAA